MKIVILTGSSSGLGKALFYCLSKENIFLVCISRRFLPDQLEIANKEKDRIKLIEHDLRDTETLISKCNVQQLVPINQIKEIIFINNAGIIEPISQIGCLEQDLVTDAISVNFTAIMVHH